MPVVKIYQYFTVDVDPEHPVTGGSLSKARTIVLGDGELLDHTHKVAPNTAVKIFDKAEMETLGNFDFLWLETDRDVLIQLTNDDDEFLIEELVGSDTLGEPGPGLCLASDDTQQGGTIDLFDGDASTIKEIWAYNEDDDDTARVRIVVGT